jgi:hypothetical protein
LIGEEIKQGKGDRLKSDKIKPLPKFDKGLKYYLLSCLQDLHGIFFLCAFLHNAKNDKGKIVAFPFKIRFCVGVKIIFFTIILKI